jgi:hypothetical protein
MVDRDEEEYVEMMRQEKMQRKYPFLHYEGALMLKRCMKIQKI